MYAIAFDLEVSELKKHYGDPYNGAYMEVGKELKSLGFEWTQGNVYLNNSSDGGFAIIHQVIVRLSAIGWFVKSVRDIRAFKVEDWSDLTAIVKAS